VAFLKAFFLLSSELFDSMILSFMCY